MNTSITHVRAATAAEWDTTWSNCEYATFFQSREWAAIWHDYTDGSLAPAPRLVTFSDGSEALLPFSYGSWPADSTRRYLSSPAGTYGGWISRDTMRVAHGQLLQRYIERHYRNLVWRLNPYDDLAVKAGIETDREDETHAIRLVDDIDSMVRRWTKGHRSAARQAQRKGVTVGVASTRSEWDEYYRAYIESRRRWGDQESAAAYEEGFFQMLFDRSSPHMRLWTARHDGRVIAGALCFYAKRHAAYWHGAAFEQFFPLRPVHLIMFEAIRDAHDRGCDWFDLNPSGGHEGVRRFKKGFGAVPLPCPVVHRQTAVARISQALSRRRRQLFAAR
jgi:CelD/BcsL family acetyltransferase involved in cellulose biosynthesis